MNINQLRAFSLSFLYFALSATVSAQGTPHYKVDPFWPKPLPNNWIIQGVPRIAIDKEDHVWLISRPSDILADPSEAGAEHVPPFTDCCAAPPAVLEFDTDGNLLKAWGGKDYVPGWPRRREHALLVDGKGNVWIGGNDPGDTLLGFTPDGKFLSEFGHRGPVIPTDQQKQDNQQTNVLVRGIPAPAIDDDAQELYVADGYLNKRVLVYDLVTGAFKRGWGAYGIPLNAIDNNPAPTWNASDPPPKQFTPPVHCIHISKDGLVYVCDRGSDRVQVFTKQGKFIQEFFVHRTTPGTGPTCAKFPCGTVYELAFSNDAKQKYLFVADGTNNVVWILDRSNGKILGSVGHFGRYAGQFHQVDGLAVDSHGNMYTGEVGTGKRVQKFVLVSNN
jgi:hypothetical protein